MALLIDGESELELVLEELEVVPFEQVGQYTFFIIECYSLPDKFLNSVVYCK